MDGQKGIKKIRVRSPNYPAFSLAEAIEKARILFEKDGKAGAHKSVVLEHLGYTSEHGASLRAISALKTYGLISEEDSHIKLTDDALNVILYPNNEEKHQLAVLDLYLKP